MKKTIKKTQQKKQPAAAGEPKTTILKWFFTPDTKQGLGKWTLRAGLFTVGCFAFAILISAFMLRGQLIAKGMPPIPLLDTIKLVALALAESPLRFFVVLVANYAFGMFAFMPRKPLDRTGYVAVHWTSLALCLATAAATLLMDEYMKGSGLIIIPFVLLMLEGIAYIAAVACYALKHGLPKLATFLSFPFGFALYVYAGHFLPAKDKERTIEIKYGWYRRLIDFVLNTTNGQIVLALIFLASFAVGPSWFEALAIALFGGLYFWKGGKWILGKLPKLSWAAVALNVATIALGIYFVYFRLSHIAIMIMMDA
ncbi:MAG: hypothetical protein LBL21_01580 [Rickettsiales bacterium]|nr:hypothetical protein [Rickettsiales bacterium]